MISSNCPNDGYAAGSLIDGGVGTNALSELGDRVVPKNFHESYATGDVRPPSDPAASLVFAAVTLIIAVLWRNSSTVLWVALGIAAMLAIVSLIAPVLLKPLNMLWFRFGLLLHRVVNPIVMFVIFALVFVPAGAIMRLRHDPLRVRRARDASSYWIDDGEGEATAGSMTNQF